MISTIDPLSSCYGAATSDRVGPGVKVETKHSAILETFSPLDPLLVILQSKKLIFVVESQVRIVTFQSLPIVLKQL